MKHMTLSEIADACCGIYCGDPAFLDCEVSSVAIDSRKVIKDTLFVAIKGARVDGHSFIPQVMEAGALCSLSEQDLGDVDYPYIRVSSCTEALKDLAEHYRRSLDIKVVGITGSVGKYGIVIKYNANQKYCTDAVSAAEFIELCAKADVPYQTFVNRSDIAGGSTLGNISNTQVAMNTVDIGLPQLAMHSPYETAGVKDTEYLIRVAGELFA